MTAKEAAEITKQNTVRLPMCDDIDSRIREAAGKGLDSIKIFTHQNDPEAQWPIARLAKFYCSQGFHVSYSDYSFEISW